MDTLSSCYFCGTALDKPLSTYRVGRTDGSAVCLCQGCHRKLETLFAAAGVEESVLGEASDTTTATDEDGSVTPVADEVSADEPETDASDILVDPETDDGTDAGSTEDEVEPDVPEGFGTVDIGGGAESSDGDNEDAGDGSATASTNAESEQQTGSEVSDGQSTAETEDDTETAGDDPADGEASGTAGSDGAGGDLAARTSLTALEYNKVMRLLQNRAFPVDREEILTVASNAYELRRSECAEVIDLAVDRGLIDEQEGQLRRPAEE